MSDVIHCDKHGDSVATYVCKHIAETLRDSKVRGFVWCLADDGEYYADCTSCNALSDDEWTRQVPSSGVALCYGCFKMAAKLNRVEVDDEPRGRLQ